MVLLPSHAGRPNRANATESRRLRLPAAVLAPGLGTGFFDVKSVIGGRPADIGAVVFAVLPRARGGDVVIVADIGFGFVVVLAAGHAAGLPRRHGDETALRPTRGRCGSA